MEISLSVLIFNHSEEKHKLKCEYFLDLGDGDSKTHQAVVECAFIRERMKFLWAPKFKYIWTKHVNKINISVLQIMVHWECSMSWFKIKKMGASLRNFKLKSKGLILSDGKGIKGDSIFTNRLIDQLLGYSGGAIRTYQSNLDGMRRAVWAS